MPQLDVSTYISQIFWLVVSFGILCIFISMYIAPRIGMNLNQRTHVLEEKLSQAKRLLEEAERLHQTSLARLSHARHEASQHLQQTLHDISQQRTESLREFDHKTQTDLATLAEKLELQKKEILKSADNLVSHVVETIFNKVVGCETPVDRIQKAIKVVNTGK